MRKNLLNHYDHLKYLLLVSFIVICGSLSAQNPGELDLSFNPTDKGFNFGDGVNLDVYTVVEQLDGKIIIGGDFTSYNGKACNRIARINVDGSLDTSFDTGTGFDGMMSGDLTGFIRAAAIQADGKIVVVGSFSSFNGASVNGIVRLNANGSIDTSFNPGTGTNASINAVTFHDQNKIIIGGDFTSYNGTPRNRIARLNMDGSLDVSFDPGTGFDASVHALASPLYGDIIVGGAFGNFNGINRKGILRLKADGSYDDSFDSGVGTNNAVRALTVQADGKIIIGGAFWMYNNIERNYRIARLNANGSLDEGFNPVSGVATIYGLDLQSDEKIIVGGYRGVVRLYNTGELDSDFVSSEASNVHTTVVLNDDKLIVGGFFSDYNGSKFNYFVRLNAVGSIDKDFNEGTAANGTIRTAVIQPDGKIIISGDFKSYNGVSRIHIARLNADGSLDVSFDPGASTNKSILCTVVQADGKIIIGGSFTSYYGINRKCIARLNTDGSLDESFASGTGFDYHDSNLNQVQTIALQEDGKIIAGGFFSSYDGVPSNYIVRLETDGSLDASFDTGAGFDTNIEAMALQEDGKVLVSGHFTTYNNTESKSIIRLNSDGSKDLDFYTGLGPAGIISSIVPLEDGRILISGGFQSFNDIDRRNIAILNSTGRLDTSFEPNTAIESSNGVTNEDGALDDYLSYDIYSINSLSDGRILAAGKFINNEDMFRYGIIRIYPDGRLDSFFNSGTGPDDAVLAIAELSEHEILLAGSFSSYNGIGRNRIAKIYGGGEFITGIATDFLQHKIKVYPNPFTDYFRIEFDNVISEEVEIKLLELSGRILYSQTFNTEVEELVFPVSVEQNLTNGIYLLQLRDGNSTTLHRVIKQ